METENQMDLPKMVASTNVMETFLGVGHAPRKKVERADHVSEKTGEEDPAG